MASLIRRLSRPTASYRPHAGFYCHGSTAPHAIGSVLVARARATEFSDRVLGDGTNVEALVESVRPRGAPSRLKCIFLVDDCNDLNGAGAAEDYVYLVTSPRVTRANFAWITELMGRRGANRYAVECAENYWRGLPIVSRGDWNKRNSYELLASRVTIASRIKGR